MRLFVAVDLSAQTRAEVGDVQEVLEANLMGKRRSPRITWVKPEAAHVTLQFLGETPDLHASRVVDALGDQRLAEKAFEVTWGALGAFPDTRKPRVLWIGATAGTDELTTLATAVRHRLGAIGVENDARAFKAHVTIARVKDPGTGVDWADALSSLRLTPTASRIDHVTLYRSQLSPKGPRYTPVASFEF